VYAIAFRPAGQTLRFKSSYSRCPGHHTWCHGFCQRDNFVTKSTLPHRNLPAKTRATPTLRQLHIPLERYVQRTDKQKFSNKMELKKTTSDE
jgi:hypothetical protein